MFFTGPEAFRMLYDLAIDVFIVNVNYYFYLDHSWFICNENRNGQKKQSTNKLQKIYTVVEN